MGFKGFLLMKTEERLAFQTSHGDKHKINNYGESERSQRKKKTTHLTVFDSVKDL